MTGAVDHRVVLVPEGLAGERVDIALARMFGLSRSRAAELAGAGHVHVDGVAHGVWRLEDPTDEVKSGPIALHQPEMRFEVSLYHVNADMIETVRRWAPRGL